VYARKSDGNADVIARGEGTWRKREEKHKDVFFRESAPSAKRRAGFWAVLREFMISMEWRLRVV